MFSSYEWYVGSRYLRSGHRNRFISVIALISIAGLMLGVAVLIVVLSVMNGFEHELRNRILSMTPHATIMGLEGRLEDWRQIRDRVQKMPAVTAAAPYIEDQGMLVNGSHVSGALIRGIVPEDDRRVGSLGAHMSAGSLADLGPGRYRIVLGTALAQELGVRIGDTVIVVVAQGNATPVGVLPRLRRFTVSGIFSAGMYEFDRGLALVSMQDAARLYRLGDAVTGVQLSLQDLFRAPVIVRDVALALGGGFFVSDWTRKHANFFRSIEITKGILFVILLADRGRRGVQHRVDPGDGGEGKAVGHRHPAHHGLHTAQHPRHLHRAGSDHRSGRYARRCGAGRPHLALPGEPCARPGTLAAHTVSRRERVLHE